MKKCNARTSRITRKKGAVELIDMQKAFVGLAQGAWEGIARVLDFEKNDYKRRHCDRNWLGVPREGRERPGAFLARRTRTRRGMEPDDLLCSRNARPEKALVGRAQWKIIQPPSLER